MKMFNDRNKMWLFQFIVIIGLLTVKSQSQLPTDEELEDFSEPGDFVSLPRNISHSNSTVRDISWYAIYPGTKWCGRGDIAKHENDYGKYRSTDMCCHTHDICPTKIEGKTTNYGIINNSSISILSCECDSVFYDCLKKANTKTSEMVGILYFDFLKNNCIQESYAGSGQYILVSNITLVFSQNPMVKFLTKTVPLE